MERLVVSCSKSPASACTNRASGCGMRAPVVEGTNIRALQNSNRVSGPLYYNYYKESLK